MSLLSAPRCPQCSGEVPLEALWRASPTSRSNFLIGDIGIQCPHCGTRLRVLQGRASWWLFLASAAALVVVGELADRLGRAGVLPPNGAFLGAFVLLVILSWPVSRSIPRLVSFRIAYDGEILRYPLETGRRQTIVAGATDA